MYSFGVLLIELTTQTLAACRQKWRLPHVPDECPAALLELIHDCTHLDPDARPTAADALHRLQAAMRQGRPLAT